MELLSVIRRWHYRDRDHFSIREISRRTGLSRNTVRKYLRSDAIEPKFNIPDRRSKLDPYADRLSQMLRQEAGKSRKQKRTTKQLHADLVALGYDGSYNRVAAFARDWKVARLLSFATFITFPPEHVGDLAFERLLDDQLQHKANQIASSGRRPQVPIHQSAKLLAPAIGRG